MMLLAGIASTGQASPHGLDLSPILPALMLFPMAGAGGLVAACVGGPKRVLLVEALLLGVVAWKAWLLFAGDVYYASDRKLWESYAALGGCAAVLGVVLGWLAARVRRVAVAFIVVGVSIAGVMAVAWFSERAIVLLVSPLAALSWPVVAGLALRAGTMKLTARYPVRGVAARTGWRWASKVFRLAHQEWVGRIGSKVACAASTITRTRLRRALVVFVVVYGAGLWVAGSGSYRTLAILAEFASPGRMLHGMLTGDVPPVVDALVGWQLHGLITAMLVAAASTVVPIKR